MTDPQGHILETERLVLRRLRMTDLDALFALYSDEEIRRYFPDGTLTREETMEELEWFLHGHPAHPELGLWATILKDTNAFIGRCGLLPWKIEERQEVEVAYLLDKKYWGQGLATEAARAILEYGFGTLGLSRLICLIDPLNGASQKVAEHIGMRLEQEVDGIDGDGIPTLIYSVSR
jgi:[ribosomal protein S5]-alanine N-acetyltransferase